MSYDSRDGIGSQRRLLDAGSPPDSRAAVTGLGRRGSDAPPPMTAEDAVARVTAAMAAARASERGFWICY
jgi:hypothetical protein